MAVDNGVRDGRVVARFGAMTLNSYEYRDPEQVATAVVAQRPLRDGDVVLALVRDPSGDQEVLRLRSIPRTKRHGLDAYERSRLLAGYAERLRVPPRRGADSEWYSIMRSLGSSLW